MSRIGCLVNAVERRLAGLRPMGTDSTGAVGVGYQPDYATRETVETSAITHTFRAVKSRTIRYECTAAPGTTHISLKNNVNADFRYRPERAASYRDS